MVMEQQENNLPFSFTYCFLPHSWVSSYSSKICWGFSLHLQTSNTDSAPCHLCLLSFQKAGWGLFVSCGSSVSLFLLKTMEVMPNCFNSQNKCLQKRKQAVLDTCPTLPLLHFAQNNQFILHFWRVSWFLLHPRQCLRHSFLLNQG